MGVRGNRTHSASKSFSPMRGNHSSETWCATFTPLTLCSGYGIRIRVTRMKIWDPRPLDEPTILFIPTTSSVHYYLPKEYPYCILTPNYSYGSGILLRGKGSNLRPSGYEPDELPLLYPAIYLCHHKPTAISRSISTSVSFSLMLDILTYSADISLPIQFLLRSIDTFAVVPLPIKGS